MSDRKHVDPMLDRAPCAFLSFTDDGVIVRANRTLCVRLGYDPDEVVGKPFERLMGLPARIFYQTHFFPLLRLHGNAEEVFMSFRSKTGEDVGMLVYASRGADVERGDAVLNDCVLVEVRERRRYEEELLLARRASDEARDALAARTSQLEAANTTLIAQAEELEQQQCELQEQAAELEATSEELTAANEELQAQAEELDRQRQLAEEANRAKTQFLATMSHELRTPLNAIAGYVQLLELGVRGPLNDVQREDLSKIDRAQRHLTRLINDVLNLVRIESGRVEYNIGTFDVAELVTSLLPLVETQLQSKGIALNVEVDHGLCARGDTEKVEQVLLNLLSNAHKFTPAQGTIAVRGEYAREQVIVRVIDSGIGIPSDKLDSIFDPFVQVHSAPGARREGTGLGLAISRDLARGMNGDLSVESVLGAGSTFLLTLPAAMGGERQY